MNLTYIEWDDAMSPAAGPWIDHGDSTLAIDKPLTIVTIGFVIRESEHFVQLASSADLESAHEEDFEGSQVSGIMSIPQRQVSKRIEFEISDKVKQVPRIEYKRA